MDGIASGVPLITLPSFDRACSLVPSEYVQAWEWFLCEEQRGECGRTSRIAPSLKAPNILIAWPSTLSFPRLARFGHLLAWSRARQASAREDLRALGA